MKIFTVPVRLFVDVTVAVSVNDPPAGTLALDVARVIEVGTGPPPPPPPPPLLPPPQPRMMANRKRAPANSALPYLLRLPGIPRKNSINNPLAKLVDHQVHLPKGTIPFLTRMIAAAAAGPPLGPVVVSVIVTGTAVPFKFTVEGLKLRPMPDGSVNGAELSVTGLGVLDSGVTFTVTA